METYGSAVEDAAQAISLDPKYVKVMLHITYRHPIRNLEHASECWLTQVKSCQALSKLNNACNVVQCMQYLMVTAFCPYSMLPACFGANPGRLFSHIFDIVHRAFIGAEMLTLPLGSIKMH